MFQNRAEGLALALPAALFAALVFLVPVVHLLSEGFRLRSVKIENPKKRAPVED